MTGTYVHIVSCVHTECILPFFEKSVSVFHRNLETLVKLFVLFFDSIDLIR